MRVDEDCRNSSSLLLIYNSIVSHDFVEAVVSYAKGRSSWDS